MPRLLSLDRVRGRFGAVDLSKSLRVSGATIGALRVGASPSYPGCRLALTALFVVLAIDGTGSGVRCWRPEPPCAARRGCWSGQMLVWAGRMPALLIGRRHAERWRRSWLTTPIAAMVLVSAASHGAARGAVRGARADAPLRRGAVPGLHMPCAGVVILAFYTAQRPDAGVARLVRAGGLVTVPCTCGA
jgi:hypothetical protein